MEKVFVRSPYNYDRNKASDESGLDCQRRVDEDGVVTDTPSLTKQSFLEETDINTIVKRFGLTGALPSNVRAPTFGDFEDVPDYHSAMNAIRLANESFMSMPAVVRARFLNDPGRFVEFCSDEKNRDEAIKLGLVVPPSPAETASGASGEDALPKDAPVASGASQKAS